MYQIPGQFNSSPTRDSDQLCLLQRRVQVIANYRKTVSVIDNQMTVSVANNDSQFASVTDTNKNKSGSQLKPGRAMSLEIFCTDIYKSTIPAGGWVARCVGGRIKQN